MQPLDDVTIVDLSLALPGPYATKLLAQAGAEVLSIEPPGGDHLGDPDSAEYTRTYENLNTGKRSMVVNMKDERGLAFVHDVVAEADVIVEGFSPGTAERLGVGPESLRAENEELIYCSLSGYGQTGPRRNEPGHDLNYQAVAGFLDLDDPKPPKTPVADYAGSTILALAILIALRGRDRGGNGQYIDLAMYDVIASWNSLHVPWAESNDVATDYDPLVSGEYPCYNTYETADDRHLTLGAMERGFWTQLCEVLDLPGLVDEQFAPGGRESDAYHRLQEQFRTRTLDDWIDEFGEELPIAAVQTTAEAINDPQVAARDHLLAVDERTGETALAFGLPVAFSDVELSSNDESVADTLSRAGYSHEDIESLEAADVVSDLGTD